MLDLLMRRRLPRVLANTESMLDLSYFQSMPTRFNSSGHFSPKLLTQSTWRAPIFASSTPQPRTLLQSLDGIEAEINVEEVQLAEEWS